MVGSGGRRSLKLKQVPIFTYHHHNHDHDDEDHERKKEITRDIPKGCLVIKVGSEGGEKERIVVPVNYLNHPLFAELLKEAEEEYGFAHEGAIVIPCQLEQFRYVQALIDREINSLHHHHQHHLLVACFRV